MSDVFGFDEAIQDLERYSSRANNINEKMYQEGIKCVTMHVISHVD